MDPFTPAQTTELVSRIGTKKARMRLDRMFLNSFMGGPLLGFGCALSLAMNVSPWLETNAPGLLRCLGAFVFPVGLIMVILTGADLFTSYTLFSTVAFLHRRITFFDLAKTWAVSFVGNLSGMLFFVAILCGYGGLFSSGEFATQTVKLAVTRVVDPAWHEIFLRGILANWLVTTAIFLSVSAREVISKVIVIWFPVVCFVGMGTDHVVANMFFVPMAIFIGGPEKLNVGYYIWKSMIPSVLGNVVGGSVFVGGMYWYLHLAGNEVEVHFDNRPYEMNTYDPGNPFSRNSSIVGK